MNNLQNIGIRLTFETCMIFYKTLQHQEHTESRTH